MLTVNGLRVDVGGTILLDGVSFSVRGGDKVGLVGRNGAGKTTMLKLIAGESEPSRGTVRRDGGVGYLPQDPRLDDKAAARTGVEHVLSGRGLDEAVVRMEKLRVAMEEDPSARAVDRFTRAEERYRLEGGYQSDSEVRRRVDQHGVTVLCGAPTVVNLVLDAAAGLDEVPGHGRTRIVVAGAPPPTRTIERVEAELGWELIQIYGLTETAPLRCRRSR